MFYSFSPYPIVLFTRRPVSCCSRRSRRPTDCGHHFVPCSEKFTVSSCSGRSRRPTDCGRHFFPRSEKLTHSVQCRSGKERKGVCITYGKMNVRQAPRCRLNIYFNFKIFTKVKFGSCAPCRGDVSHLLRCLH